MQRESFRPGPLADVDRVPVDDRWDWSSSAACGTRPSGCGPR